jgi:hypothetical protein
MTNLNQSDGIRQHHRPPALVPWSILLDETPSEPSRAGPKLPDSQSAAFNIVFRYDLGWWEGWGAGVCVQEFSEIEVGWDIDCRFFIDVHLRGSVVS